MKTKIIYISGNELFDMADIRAAFEEVRAALSLGSDTILFGVPVDNDDALIAPNVLTHDEPSDITVDAKDSLTEQESTIVEPESTPEPPIKKAKVIPIPVATKLESSEESEPAVVPILSVLGTQTTPEETAYENNDEKKPIVNDDTKKQVDTVAEPEPESVTIADMIVDEPPIQQPEKTLEELLESMTPLGEDNNQPKKAPIADAEPEPVVYDKKQSADDDITLEKLATEFVENQDKIDTPEKPSGRGKIGKLKNILPFKKAKHDDSGLMGDLFGWAGVAANDEDFTIPGFFTNAASKK